MGLVAIFVLYSVDIPNVARITGKSFEWLTEGFEKAREEGLIFVFSMRESDLRGDARGYAYKINSGRDSIANIQSQT